MMCSPAGPTTPPPRRGRGRGERPPRRRAARSRRGAAGGGRGWDLTKGGGAWRGGVETHQGQLALMLRFKEPGDVHVRLGEQLETLLNEAKFAGDELTGVFQGDIGTSDANRRPYHLHLDLKLREGSLCGAVIVISLPTSRGGAMAYWVELKKG